MYKRIRVSLISFSVLLKCEIIRKPNFIEQIYENMDIPVSGGVENALNVNSNLSNILNAFALLTLMNYEITDNWVDCIRVYIFTEEHMFYADQFLNKTCEKKGEPRFLLSVEKKDYLNERRGSNVEWGDDPGITYDALTRSGENPERNTKTEGGQMFDELQDSNVYY